MESEDREINRPVRGIPNVHVREKPEEPGLIRPTQFLWSAKEYMMLEGSGAVASVKSQRARGTGRMGGINTSPNTSPAVFLRPN